MWLDVANIETPGRFIRYALSLMIPPVLVNTITNIIRIAVVSIMFQEL